MQAQLFQFKTINLDTFAGSANPGFMSRILNFFLQKSEKKACNAYAEPADLFAGLQAEEADAFRCLYTRISGTVYSLGKEYRLTDEDIEEVICDSITLLTQKIRQGVYTFQGYQPASYAIEIAKNRIRHAARQQQKHQSEALGAAAEMTEDNAAWNWETLAVLEKLLNSISENCRNLIRLKYLDELSDKEIIEQQRTPYTTVNALKSHRSQCMKKLTELAQSARLLDA
jgi:RNA polymerase sigma factor (sigma-70 family)